MFDLGYLALGLGLPAVYLAAMAAVLFGAAGRLPATIERRATAFAEADVDYRLASFVQAS
jgi:hypothetical protein